MSAPGTVEDLLADGAGEEVTHVAGTVGVGLPLCVKKKKKVV